MGELPLFFFRGLQWDCAMDRMWCKKRGTAGEELLQARDLDGVVSEQGNDRGWVAGMVEQWERASGKLKRLQRTIRW